MTQPAVVRFLASGPTGERSQELNDEDNDQQNQENGQLGATESTLGGKLQPAKEELKAVEGKLETVKEEMNVAEGKLETAKEELKAAKEELNAAEGKLEAAEGKLEAAKEEMKAAEGKLEAATDPVQKALAQKAYDREEKAYELAVKNVDTAREGVDTAREGVDTAREGVNRAGRAVDFALDTLQRAGAERNLAVSVDAVTSRTLAKLSLRSVNDLFASPTTPPAWPVSAAAETYGDGGSNLVWLRQKHGFFADHTAYLRKLDSVDGCVMYRPPRFGKSLWLSVMQCYYDIRYADPVGREPGEDELCFSNLFQGLAITRDETRDTSLQSAFYVLRLNFPKDYYYDPQCHSDNFHKSVNEDINAFLIDHPDVLQSSGYSTEDDIIDKDACHITLKRVVTIVNKQLKGRLMVLVDEVDRAAMTALSYNAEPNEAEDVKRYTAATEPMRSLLSGLKEMAEAGNRYFVTGIVPVALRESVFNGYKPLTFDPAFAGLYGFTEDEVRSALIHVARIEESSDELEHALTVARKCFNGHYFRGSQEALYNPQLVLQFVRDYQERFRGMQDERIASRLRDLTDWNQVPSRRQVQLLERQPDIALALLRAKKGESVKTDYGLEAPLEPEKLLKQPEALLFFLGVLTLDRDYRHADDDRHDDEMTKFRLPNAISRRAYVREYRDALLGLPSSPSRFFREPSEQHLEELLKRIDARVGTRSLKENEALLRGLLSSELLFSLQLLGEEDVFVDVEFRPAEDSYERMDIRIRTPRHVIVIELKRIPVRALTSKQPLDQPKVSQAVTGKKARNLQAKAVAQAKRYMKKHNPEGRQLVGFAVTQVAQHFLVDEVKLS